MECTTPVTDFAFTVGWTASGWALLTHLERLSRVVEERNPLAGASD